MFPVTHIFISVIITNWYSHLHFSPAEVMNQIYIETIYYCQNSFCNPQNMPFRPHNATVGTPWPTKIWLVNFHRYTQTCPHVQLPVRMLTAVVRKCGHVDRNWSILQGMMECLRQHVHLGWIVVTFLNLFDADIRKVGSLIYSSLSSLNTQYFSWNMSSF
jgi:hypothetical protein